MLWSVQKNMETHKVNKSYFLQNDRSYNLQFYQRRRARVGEEDTSVYKQRNTLYFDVSFSVQHKGQQKMIVDRVSDVIQSGEMLAIMG